jgi:hypothetical protein
MFALYRGLAAGFFVVAVAALVGPPGDLGAQDKKKDLKKDDPAKKTEMKKEDAKKVADAKDTQDRGVGFGTSDGLSLKGYWFQGAAIEKRRPDAALMFPAPGNKITDSWIDLARELSKNNFSVLLFDWRGCGLNGPEAGSRIFENKEQFWRDPYNEFAFARATRQAVEEKGLDWKTLRSKVDSRGNSYKDFLLNDLMGARFFLDKQNDAGKCNTNRVWIVSEKDGAGLGLGFIAAEFQRNSVFDPKDNPWDRGRQFKAAGKDYCGIMALSPASSGTGSMVYRNAFSGGGEWIKEAREHLERRLAMAFAFTKKEGPGNARSLISSVNALGTEEQMKRDFKYLREVDVKGKEINGISMIDTNDSFGARDLILKAMVEISKVQPFNKDPTDRDAAKMTNIPRFMIERFNRK